MSETINPVLTIEYPEEMRLLNEEESRQLYAVNPKQPEGNRSFRNEEKHTIITVCWMKQSLIEKLYSAKEILNMTEKRAAKAAPDYETLGKGESMIGHVKGNKLRYKNTVQGNHQVAEYDLCVVKGKYYSFQLIYREGFENFAESVYEKFLSSARFLL